MRRRADGGGDWRYRHDAGTEEGTGRFDDPNRAGVSGQAMLFGAGGLIHAAVGLAGGVGGFLTKRSGCSRNA